MDQPSNEQWRPIVGYEGIYEISDQGRARRVAPSRYLTPNTNEKHYVRYSLSKAGKAQMARAHCLVMEAFVGPRPEGLVIRHLNGDGRDNRLENLRYGTQSENMRDALAHGTHTAALRNAAKTHCPLGHVLEAPNLVESMLPRRKCKACDRSRKRVTYNPARVFEEDVARQYARIMAGETSKTAPVPRGTADHL